MQTGKSKKAINLFPGWTIALILGAVLAAGCPDLTKSPEKRKDQGAVKEESPDKWLEEHLASGRVKVEVIPFDADSSSVKDPQALLERLDEAIQSLPALLQQDPDPKEVDRLMKDLDAGISIVRRIGNSERVGAYYVSLALLRNHLGYRQPALSACEQVSLLLEEKNTTVWPTVARQIRGDIALALGDVGDALAQFEIAFDLAAKRKDWDRARMMFGRIEGVTRKAENRTKVKAAAEERRSRLVKSVNLKGRAMLALWEAEMELSDNQNRRGSASLSEAVGYFEKAGFPAWGSVTAFRRAQILSGMGKDALGEAIGATREALRPALAAGDYASAVNLDLQLGALLERDWTWDNIREAVIRYREAYQLAGEHKLGALEVESLNYLSLAFRNRKDRDLALACILEAQDRLKEIPSDPGLEGKVAETLNKIRETFPDPAAFEQQKESVAARKDALLREATEL
jgi:hypothetical protein